MELSLGDIAGLTWLWHDAELTKIELAYDASNDASVVLCSEINYEEDISVLKPWGISSRLVRVECSYVFEMHVNGFFSNSRLPTIAYWNAQKSGTNGIRSEIQCVDGENIQVTSRSVLLSQW